MSMFRRRLLMYQALMNKSDVINYPGLIAAWSAKGKTNDDADKAILKDLTGNGHDITLNGFAFSEMSEYGGYNVKHNFTYTSNNRCDKIERLGYKLTFINIKENHNLLFAFPNEIYSSIGCKIKVYVKGIPNGGELFFGDNKWIHANKDGIYEGNVVTNNNGNVTIASLNCIGSTISVEFLPEYPDALVFDGVNDYGFCTNIPLLEDYTIIAKRKDCSKGCLFTKGVDSNGAFILEGFGFVSNTYNFGRRQNKNLLLNNTITWQNKNSYNQQNLIVGNKSDTTNRITIGALNDTDSRRLKGAFYFAYLFERSLDEQEIKAFIRKYIDPEYLLPSEIPTPDCYYDFSKGGNDDADRNTIKDYSGNGNDAVAHNFGWNENSGYGGCANFVQWNNIRNNYIGSITSNKIYISESKTDSKPILYSPGIRNLMKFKVEGLSQNQSIRFGSDINNSTLLEVTQDGIYEVDWNKSTSTRCIIPTFIGECDITIELLPEYPGALVFDGTDDYVSLDAFDSGFKTMFMVCNPRNKSNVFLYEQRKNTELPYDYGLYTYNSVAYNIRNANGTYINGIKNTKVFTKDLNNKKILISVNSKLTQLNKPTIGVGITGNYSNMALYKFLGFKEALTEEQIQAVIKKYNLLDGVDEIEVS